MKKALSLLGGVADSVLKKRLRRLLPIIRGASGERKRAGQARRWAGLLFAHTEEGAAIADRQGIIVAVNPAFTAITGYSESEILGQNMRRLHSGQDDPAFSQQMWQAILSAGAWQGEIRERRKNGEVYLQRIAVKAVCDARGEVSNYVAMFADLTRLPGAERTESPAQHDALTGLPNRPHLLSRLQHALEIAKRNRSRGAVLFLDLDGFEAVDDAWGHAAGEELLQQAARRLAGRFRDMDTLARLGGGTFVAVLEDLAAADGAEAVAGEAIRLLNQPFVLAGGQEACIGGHIGIALFPEAGEEAESLLRLAEAALREAQRTGRNAYRFHADGRPDE